MTSKSSNNILALFPLFLSICCFPIRANEVSENLPKTINLAADDWCPYTCNPASGKAGFIIDISKEIFKKHGIKLKYRFITWTNAIQKTRRGKYHGIVGAFKSDAPDFIFPQQAVGIAENIIYAHPDDFNQYKTLDDFKYVSLGLIQDYSYGDELDKYVQQHKNNREKIQLNTGSEPLYRNIEKVLKRQIDATIEDKAVMAFHQNNYPEQTPLKAITTWQSEAIYVAFSPRKEESEHLAKLFDKGLAELERSGELKNILAKYGLRKWKK